MRVGQVASVSDDAGMTQRYDWAATLAAAASRVGLALLFAPFVVMALPSDAASRVFQLLFLQGGLIALLSASAYARAAQLAAGGGPVWPAARSFGRFLGLGTGVAILAGLVLPVPGESTAVKLGLLAMLVTGAAGSALTGFLQGVVVIRHGGLAAFLPTILVSIPGVVGILALWRPQPLVVVVAIWVLPQILNSVVLMAAVPSARRVFRRAGEGQSSERSFFAATGAANAASVAVGYAFRDRWAATQSEGQAELGFFVVRITELVYQVLYMGAASMPATVNRVVSSRLETTRGRVQFLVIGLVSALLALAPSIVWTEWDLRRFAIAELAVAPARVLTMLCWLFLLGRETTRAYQAAVLAGSALAFAAIVFAPLQASPYGLQAFQLVNLAPAVLIATVVGRQSREAQSPVPTLATCATNQGGSTT